MIQPLKIDTFLEPTPFENVHASGLAIYRTTVREWSWTKPHRNDRRRLCCGRECRLPSRRLRGKLSSHLVVVMTILFTAALLSLPCEAQNVNVQQRPEYFVDVLVVSDVPIYNAWYGRAHATAEASREEATLNDIRRYFTLVIQEVNKRYRTLEEYNNFRLTVRPVGFYIGQNVEDSQWTVSAREGSTGQVDAQGALRNLARWVATTPGLPRHDHTMLMTGYDLVTDDSGVLFRYTIGRATVGTVCQGGGRSVSVVEDRGAFQSVHTAAHELGHSLGAGHDGAGNRCRAADRFIMAGGTEPRTAANLRHPWFFSPCSAREIAIYINALLDVRFGRQCLLTALPQVGVPNVQGLVPGQLYDPDQQCQHIYGPQSRYCYGGNFGTLEEICTTMFCLVPNDRRRNFCVEYHAAHGTSCGAGRWCEAGACVANQNAPNTTLGQCPFGDQLILINRRPCPQAVSARPALCYNRRVRNICCATCARTHTNRRGCPFGNRVRNCRADLCNTLLPDGTPYARQCCGTCNFDITRWTCADAPQGVNGQTCPAAVHIGQVQGCYNATLAFICCATCQGQRNPNARAGCEYGDLLLQTCQNRVNANQTCNRQSHWQCCQTCNDNDVRQGITSSGTSHGSPQSTLQLLMWCISVLHICRLK